MELAYLIIKFVLSAFAVYRAARMAALEEGPGGAFHEWREQIDPHQKTWVGRGIRCPLCVGFWLSLIPAIAFFSLDWVVLMWLAIAGAQTYLQETEGNL